MVRCLGRDKAACVEPYARLQFVARTVGFSSVDEAVRLASDSNDAWRIGDSVLRICWRGDAQRLHREALLLERLPPSVPHPELLGVGDVDGLSWTVTRWVADAPNLADVWYSMPERDRDGAVAQLAAAMETLHAWEPDDLVRASLAERAPAATITDVLGADLNPLPVDRALQLIEPARQVRFGDSDVIEELASRLESLRHVDDLDSGGGVVVHGDLHLNNVMWSGGRIAAIVDFEWARLGPADLELQPLLRPEPGHPPEIVGQIARYYSALVSDPDTVDRLWLYDLAFTLRHLLVWPPAGPPSELPEWHPLRRLPAMLRGPGYIATLLSE